MQTLENDKKRGIDWLAFGVAGVLTLLGIITMSTFEGSNPFFVRQLIWFAVSALAFFGASRVD